MRPSLSRRLKRLESQVTGLTDEYRITVQFVDPEKGVTSTLLITSGKQVWNPSEGVPIKATVTPRWHESGNSLPEMF